MSMKGFLIMEHAPEARGSNMGPYKLGLGFRASSILTPSPKSCILNPKPRCKLYKR